jgi:lysyl-tRNA synthetase class 2
MGKVTFAHIEDGWGRLQLFLRVNEVGQEQMQAFQEDYNLGDFIEATGVMFRTRTGEATLHVHSFRMLAKAILQLPAAKDEVVDGEVVRHATLADPEVR